MLETFVFDVCHDVYRAAREAIDSKIPTLNAEASGKYEWRPDRLPRLAEYVCDFARAGERALGESREVPGWAGMVAPRRNRNPQTEVCATQFCATRRRASSLGTTFRASHMAMFRLFYLGGAEYQAARRHLGISELIWADWADEIRRAVGRELMRAGLFPPHKYFREATRGDEEEEIREEAWRAAALAANR
jgi:hypothetical protein